MIESFSKYIARKVTAISPCLFYKIAYFHHWRRVPNFDNPKDLSEILISNILSGRISKLYHLADKVAVRDFVKAKGYDSILPQLFCVASDSLQIDFQELPSQFALKANFGAGMNYICRDKNSIDETEVRKIAQSWLDSPLYSLSEAHYNLIERKLLCEEFIDDGSGHFPTDYKFICIAGKAYCVLVCSNREMGHADYMPYSLQGEPLIRYSRNKDFKDEIMMPDNLGQMVEVAENLASDLDLVRIDLYSNGVKIWFGEITLTPDGGIFRRWSREAIDELGCIYREKCKS